MQTLMKISFEKEFPNIGNKIKKARQESGKTLTELAFAAGISTNHWIRIEKEGVKVLPESVLRGIEQALKIDLAVKYND
jgi:transcriptional regulator with XRE-family HTH domain